MSLSVKEKLFKEHAFTCAWCSRHITLLDGTIDHAICESAGGSDWIGNLLPSCYSCNWNRGHTAIRQWLDKCLEQGLNVRKKAINKAIKRTKNDPRCYRNYWLIIKEGSQSVNLLRHIDAKRRREANDRIRQAMNAIYGYEADYYYQQLLDNF